MDSGGLQERRIGSVKVVIDSHGERITEGNSVVKKLQNNYSEYPTRELHQVRQDTIQLNESRKLAESATAQAETELFSAKKTAKSLNSAIKESNLRAKPQLGPMEKLKMREESEGGKNNENSQLAKVLRELRSVKRELSKLKLDMARILDEKRRAEKETESSVSKMTSYSSSVESLTKEIEEINEENVLVELARIEALKEYEEIEAQKKEAAKKHSNAMVESRKKMNEMIQEIEYSEQLEEKLAITVSDIKMLENVKEMKEMDKRLQRSPESRLALESIEDEFEATKKELALVKEESFQFMSSMDIVRDELKHVAEESARLRRKEEKADRTVQNLNSKLLRAKEKLEAVSTDEDQAKSTASSLSHTLDQLKTETESAKRELFLINEETAITKAEIQKTDTEIDLAEERLQIVIQELKTAKSSEAIALQNLESIIEKTMSDRASASRDKSTITISKLEYDYLTGHASGAKEIADKKVAAAEAWVEALKASEKEIRIKMELARRETRELKVEEDRAVNVTEKSLHAKEIIEEELQNRRKKYEAEHLQPEIGLSRKSMNRSGKRTPARRGKHRISASPMVRNVPRSTSFTVRGRRKVLPNLVKFFSGRNNEANVKHV
ncbi:protein PLASTID MOVEMENT IMPAIRED 2-like isoform X2 [Olea europaea var. sylvestris]|uniref:protein PLASTID MOVEMENT IMPAIRED 2-like isoform X2 n=1 Tax=Olea europaea var. sylvestris TaxID=158386 RepID=UPI000C1D0EC0|nr:protein PLASTID MOVEMENT IMPAIRED 2-like isoform X2 [Olea europaea var. sylvestris]